MDKSVAIISFLVLGAFLIPTFYLSFSRKNKKKTFLNTINAYAGSKSCKISQYDQWKNSCIGIDIDNHKVFHVRKNSRNMEQLEISIPEVAKCKIEGISLNGETIANRNSIDKVELAFSYREPAKGKTLIEFFNTETDYSFDDDDLKLAEKWFKIVHAEMINFANKNIK